MPSLLNAVTAAARGLELDTRDKATLALAKHLAQAIDGADDLDAVAKLSPRLLDCLRDLGMTPAARAKVSKGGDPGAAKPAARVRDQLRERRASRAARAQ